MTSADIWKEDGNEKYKSKDYRGAIESYTAAIQLDSQNATLYTNRAAARLMLVQYKEAVDDCNMAIAISNDNTKAIFRKVTALKGLGRLNEALETVVLGLSFDPTNKVALQEKHNIEEAKVRIGQAKSLLEEKKYSRSLAVVDDLLRDLGSGCRELNAMKVTSLIELRRLEEALNLTNAMMRVAGSTDNELLMLRSKCLYRMGDLENALKHLKEAMRADPDNSEIRTQLRHVKQIEEQKESGSTAYKNGQYQIAIDNWMASIAMDAENRQYNSKLYSNCANAYSRLKQHEAAVKSCEHAILCDRNNIKAYLRRAESYYAIGTEESLNAAIRDYEKVAEMQGSEGGNSMEEKIRKAKIAIKMTKRKDLYKILGVTRDADDNEIKKAYKKMALKCHPDKQAGKSDEEREAAVAQFKAIGEAYEILSDPEKKNRYDEGVDIEDLDNPHGSCGHGGHGGMDPNVLFQMFMQQQAGMRGGGGGFRFG